MMMDYAREPLRATDYGVQSSISSLTRILSAVIAGVLVGRFGYASMFLFEISAMGLVFGIVWIYYEEK
ncbi:MAG: hypothetical protein CSA22_05230 [Deltaproteobacteria bacterium]|nr:MAG: hypothetical protein CSA22_05230 [Deltaproteobacteria bacterium]